MYNTVDSEMEQLESKKMDLESFLSSNALVQGYNLEC